MRRGVAAALVLAALALAGCGSKGETTTSAQATWTNGFCGALVTWRDGVRSAGTSLKDLSTLSKSKIDSAATSVKAANEALTSSLKALGPPPKVGTPKAKAAVQDLSTKLAASANEIKGAVANISSGNDIVNAVSVASSALATMASDISATVDQLRSLDAADEWKQAFADSDACQSLKQS